LPAATAAFRCRLATTVESGNVKLDLEPAPVWRRLAAFCYDALVLAAIVVCFTLLVLAVRLGAAVPPGSYWFPAALLAITMAFFCGFWARGGQTLGMRAWRIRVVRDDGSALTWRCAALRFAAAILSALPAGLGLWWSLFDTGKRGWHDRWTGTRVVRVTNER
jgi:uncharacterized RDD family membrane protein YckC